MFCFLFFFNVLSVISRLQVLISYIDLLYTTEDRNSRLRESYFFTCDCQECSSKSMVRRSRNKKNKPKKNDHHTDDDDERGPF